MVPSNLMFAKNIENVFLEQRLVADCLTCISLEYVRLFLHIIPLPSLLLWIGYEKKWRNSTVAM